MAEGDNLLHSEFLPCRIFNHRSVTALIHCQIPDSTRSFRELPSVVLNSSAASILEVCSQTNDIAREIGEMDPDDPLRTTRVKELYALTELIKLTKAERNKLIYEKMDALAYELTS